MPYRQRGLPSPKVRVVSLFLSSLCLIKANIVLISTFISPVGGKVALSAFHSNAFMTFHMIFSSAPTAADFANTSTVRKQITPDVRFAQSGKFETPAIDLSSFPEAKE